VAAAVGLSVRGFVLSQPTPATDESGATNAATIATLTDLPVLGVLGHGPVSYAMATELADAILDTAA
jgi:hypothetical protein